MQRPQGNDASPEESTAKKRRLAWLAKLRLAAGVDMKSPDGDQGGGSEEQDLVFGIIVKMGIRFFGQWSTPLQQSP